MLKLKNMNINRSTVAQMVERSSQNPEIPGSNLATALDPMRPASKRNP